MIYKAFLNRQEITGFPVKGKDVSKIYGGNILLWEKEKKIKEAFTVDGYHANRRPVTNGKRIFENFVFSGTYSNKKQKWAFIDFKSPYFNKIEGTETPKDRVSSTCATAEYNGIICLTQITGFFEKYANQIYTLYIEIHSFNDGNEILGTCTINAEEDVYYDLVDTAWQNEGCVYLHLKKRKKAETSKVCEVVFKISTDGTLLGKYEKWKENASTNDFIISTNPSYSTITSGSKKYLANICGFRPVYELHENPFETTEIATNGFKYYVGSTNNKHFFMDFETNNGETLSKVYEFVEGEFVKKRITYKADWYTSACVYRNHLYTVNDKDVLDCGDVETGKDEDTKIIGQIPYYGTIELFFVQAGYIYILYSTGKETSGLESLAKHYMTIIPL